MYLLTTIFNLDNHSDEHGKSVLDELKWHGSIKIEVLAFGIYSSLLDSKQLPTQLFKWPGD